MNRSLDWMTQAKADLEHARKSVPMTDYEWACFAAQQAAEKAVKALHLSRGTVAWGHSVLDLVGALADEMDVPVPVTDAARRLDRFYISPRYPDVHPAGSPRRYFAEADAQQGIADAEKVVSWCDQNLPCEP